MRLRRRPAWTIESLDPQTRARLEATGRDLAAAFGCSLEEAVARLVSGLGYPWRRRPGSLLGDGDRLEMLRARARLVDAFEGLLR